MSEKPENSIVDQALAEKFVVVATKAKGKSLDELQESVLDTAAIIVQQRGNLSRETQEEILHVTDSEYRGLLVNAFEVSLRHVQRDLLEACDAQEVLHVQFDR